MARLPRAALWALLLLALVLSPVLGLLTPYAALIVVIPLFIVTLLRRNGCAAYSSYDARILLGVFVWFLYRTIKGLIRAIENRPYF